MRTNNFSSKCSLPQRPRSNFGFTLIELVTVIVLLGVVSLGVTSFIKMTAQTFVNVSSRDELLSTARFAIERLNREIRNAVPNSVRVHNFSSNTQCIEFAPIVASTIYKDIPVSPEEPSEDLKVIPFTLANGNSYSCGVSCTDSVIVYPTSSDDVYNYHLVENDGTGKAFRLKEMVETSAEEWTLTVVRGLGIVFDEESPTKRLYIANSPVSYCLQSGKLSRHTPYPYMVSVAHEAFLGSGVIMAENINQSIPAFTVTPASLQRNGVVEIELHFKNDDEEYVLNNQIQLKNVP